MWWTNVFRAISSIPYIQWYMVVIQREQIARLRIKEFQTVINYISISIRRTIELHTLDLIFRVEELFSAPPRILECRRPLEQQRIFFFQNVLWWMPMFRLFWDQNDRIIATSYTVKESLKPFLSFLFLILSVYCYRFGWLEFSSSFKRDEKIKTKFRLHKRNKTRRIDIPFEKHAIAKTVWRK